HLLKERLSRERLHHLVCVPSSFQARGLIIEHELPLSDLERSPRVDVTVDGADEVDNERNLIKGGGGCHLQEKILAFNSSRLFIIVDERKRSAHLGDQWKKGIPLEVLPMACKVVQRYLREHLPACQMSLRMATEKLGPIITDNGNFILDLQP